jgi:rhamnosyltransferase
MNTRDLSIVILTKNGGKLFAEVLAGLFACEGISEAEVLMIDSGSRDLTLEYAKQYPQLRVHGIPASEFGHGKTRNLGAQLTNRPVIVYLVQDATPATPDFLERLATPIFEEGFAGVFGRQVPRLWTNTIERMFLGRTYPDRREVRECPPDRKLRIKDIFFSNVCSAIRRDVWKEIPFDESIIMSEDQLWARQVMLAGHRILYEPRATVVHSHNYKLKEVFRRNFDSGASLVGIADDTFTEMAGYEIRHLASCTKELAGGSDWWRIPYLFAYEVTRAIAFAAGQKAHLLPRRLSRMFSLHKYYWEGNRAEGGRALAPR